jgi:hypothetical protein
MSDFLRVFGKYPGTKKDEGGFLFLNRAGVKALWPVWAKKEADGKLYSCSPTLEGADVHYCLLVDFEGNKYRLPPKEWDKLLSQEEIRQMTNRAEEEKTLGFRPVDTD